MLLHLAGCFLNLLGDLAFAFTYAGVLVETNGKNAQKDNNGYECPSGFLEEVSSFRSTHYLVTTGETCGQTAAFRVLYQHKKHHEDAGQYDEDSQK